MKTNPTAGVITAAALLIACAPKRASNEVDLTPAALAASDTVRGEKLAIALKSDAPSVRPVTSTMKLRFNMDAVRAGVAGSAIVAFVVMPNGRVDRDSRTLIYVEGHQIYAKNVCDALLAARFEPAPPDERGAVGVMPVFFSIRDGASRDSARVDFEKTQRLLRERMRTMSQVEAKSWFAARPNCSAIKIGIERVYK